MEDKWWIYAIAAEDESATDSKPELKEKSESETKKLNAEDSKTGRERMKIVMLRSWTGKSIYELHVLLLGSAEEGGRITGLTWEIDEEIITGQTEEVAKERTREVCRWVLGVVLGPDVPKRRREKVSSDGGE